MSVPRGSTVLEGGGVGTGKIPREKKVYIKTNNGMRNWRDDEHPHHFHMGVPRAGRERYFFFPFFYFASIEFKKQWTSFAIEDYF